MQTCSIPGRKLYCPVLVNIAFDVSLKLYSSAVGRFSSRFKNSTFTQINQKGQAGVGGGGSGSLSLPWVCPFRLPSLILCL